MKQRKELKEINVLCSREKSQSGTREKQTIKCVSNKGKHDKEEREDNGFHGSVVGEEQLKEGQERESNYISIPSVNNSFGNEIDVDEIKSKEKIPVKSDDLKEECDNLDVQPERTPKQSNSENDHEIEHRTVDGEGDKSTIAEENKHLKKENQHLEEQDQHLKEENLELKEIKEVNEVSERTTDEMPKQKLNDLRPIEEEGEGTSKIANDKKEKKDECSESPLVVVENNVETQKEKDEQKIIRRNSTGKAMRKKLLDKRPASSAERTQRYEQMFDRTRSYSAADVVRYKTNKSKTMSPRRSRDMFSFSKRELEWYLPRKSNFDCHEKAVKDAGHETEEKINKIEEMKKRITEKLQREKEARLRAKGIFPEASNGTDKKDGTDTISIDDPSKKSLFEDIKDDDGDENENDIDNVVTAVEINSHHSPSLQRHSSTISKKSTKGRRRGHHDDDEDDVKVDYQPLVLYLKYVNENPNEFLSHQKTSALSQYIGQKANQRTQRMAEIIEKKHRQGNVVSCRGSVLLQAVKDIRPRFTDPGQWTIATKERNLMNNISALNSRKDPPFQNQKQEMTDSNQNTEEPKNEYEKEKAKLEKWLKTVSTAQLNKAKELALKELGEEDRYQTKWWNALQTCSYLRQKGMKDIKAD